jgi:hypothetical protein
MKASSIRWPAAMTDMRLIDPTRTGEHFETWLLTDPLDIRSAVPRKEIPTMKRLQALAYWRERGFYSTKLNGHEYTLFNRRQARADAKE